MPNAAMDKTQITGVDEMTRTGREIRKTFEQAKNWIPKIEAKGETVESIAISDTTLTIIMLQVLSVDVIRMLPSVSTLLSNLFREVIATNLVDFPRGIRSQLLDCGVLEENANTIHAAILSWQRLQAPREIIDRAYSLMIEETRPTRAQLDAQRAQEAHELARAEHQQKLTNPTVIRHPAPSKARTI